MSSPEGRMRPDPDDELLEMLRAPDHRIGSAVRRLTSEDFEATAGPTLVWDRILEAARVEPRG